MPLVTRLSTQGNVYRQATEPTGWVNGDLWIDTDDGLVYVNISGTATLVAPVTSSSTTTFTNKTIDEDAAGNSITNLANANIKAAAGIVYSKLNLATSIVNADISTSAAIAISKLADGIQYKQLASSTLGSAGDTISLTGITAKTLLKIDIHLPDTTNINANLTFNNDTGTNYAYRIEENGGADTTATGQSNILLIGALTQSRHLTIYVINVATAVKLAFCLFAGDGGAAAATTAPTKDIIVGKWSNTADQITRVDLTNTQAGTDMPIGSSMTVSGSNLV